MEIFHKWSKWEEDSRGDVVRFIRTPMGERLNERKVADYVRLKKTCSRCGDVRFKTVEINTLSAV